MNQADAIIEGLKKALRLRGISYGDLARKLKLSEASVKRVFSNGTFKLERLANICDALEITFADLIRIAEIEQRESTFEYSLVQEVFLAEHPKHLAFFDLLLNGHSPRNLIKTRKLSSKECAAYFRKLEELKLLEWLPEDKVKLLVSREVRWRKDGPLRKKYFEQAKNEFLGGGFHDENEKFKFMMLKMTKANFQKASHQLERLTEEWTRNSNIERQMGVESESIGIVLALRPWKFSVLEKLC